MTSRLIALAAVLALTLAACGEEDTAGAPTGDDTEAAATTEAATPEDTATDDMATTEDTATPEDTATETTDGGTAAGETTVATAETEFGEVLVDGEGLALYVFDNDEGGESSCYDDCAANWPPLTVEGEPAAGDGADEGLLGTTERDDGTQQVTYDGRPLYYFAADSAPGDVNGQAVGDVWWLVEPSGAAIEETEAATTESGMGGSDY